MRLEFRNMQTCTRAAASRGAERSQQIAKAITACICRHVRACSTYKLHTLTCVNVCVCVCASTCEQAVRVAPHAWHVNCGVFVVRIPVKGIRLAGLPTCATKCCNYRRRLQCWRSAWGSLLECIYVSTQRCGSNVNVVGCTVLTVGH